MKNPIPDATTARRWNLLSDASSSAVDQVPGLDVGHRITRRSCRLTRRLRPAAFLLLRRKLQSPGKPQPTCR